MLNGEWKLEVQTTRSTFVAIFENCMDTNISNIQTLEIRIREAQPYENAVSIENMTTKAGNLEFGNHVEKQSGLE